MTIAFAGRSTILFDLDGTISDSGPLIRAGVDAACDAVGGRRLAEREAQALVGPPFEMEAPRLLAEQGLDPGLLEQFIATFRGTVGAAEAERGHAFPGVVELVHALAAEGRRVAVVTSKPQPPADVVVDVLGLRRSLVGVVGREPGAHEPKEETMRRAIELLDVEPSQAVMVGDRHYDVTAASAHGIPAIGVTWAAHATAEELTGAGAAVVVDTVPELADALHA